MCLGRKVEAAEEEKDAGAVMLEGTEEGGDFEFGCCGDSQSQRWRDLANSVVSVTPSAL